MECNRVSVLRMCEQRDKRQAEDARTHVMYREDLRV